MRLPILGIVNVAQSLRSVQLQVEVKIDGEYSEPDRLQFWAADANSAAQIAALLPSQQTVDFARALQEKTAFDEAIKSLGTRVRVTPVIGAVNILAFVATAGMGAGWLQPHPGVLIQWGSNFGPRTLDGEWWRLLTSMFLHFGLVHLALNMWVLSTMGPLIEKLFGSAHYALLYLVAGLAGSIASVTWNPAVNSVGASGAIFGLLGGLLAFMINPRTRVPPSVVKSQRNSALVFIFYNLLNGLGHAGIDNACHIGGLTVGFLMGLLLARPLDVEARSHNRLPLTLSFLIGALLLIGLAWPMTHQSADQIADRHLRDEFRWFATQESEALARTEALQVQLNEGQLSAQEWATRINSDVIPVWNGAKDRMLDVPIPRSSKLLPFRDALVKYVDERVLAMSLLADGQANNSSADTEWGQSVLKQASQTAALAFRLYREAPARPLFWRRNTN